MARITRILILFTGILLGCWIVRPTAIDVAADKSTPPPQTTNEVAANEFAASEFAPNEFAYGFNVAEWDIGRVQSLGFNWIKVFNPPGERLPVNVLLRVDANAGHLANLDGFGDALEALARDFGNRIDAYEIGNEPNLDASYGWAAAPIAADYARLLCEAYGRIKSADPQSIVISAGLAPTGRVSGNWQGHPGHNGLFQDERAYFQEFADAGGGACLDGVGYHPYGFSADFDAAPDVASADPRQNCVNGFCFRGTEKLYELMVANGLGNKGVWATEYGWIVRPPDHCLNDPGWQGRQWQIVSEQQQADNLAGSFLYARQHWPWMRGMFVFNLNFNLAGYYPECEQMRYYAVANRPAETALLEMPKFYDLPTGVLSAEPAAIELWRVVNTQPFAATHWLRLENKGLGPLNYTISADATAALIPTLPTPNGTLQPGESRHVAVVIESDGRPRGTYQGALTITAPDGTQGTPLTIPVKLTLARGHLNFLPINASPSTP